MSHTVEEKLIAMIPGGDFFAVYREYSMCYQVTPVVCWVLDDQGNIQAHIAGEQDTTQEAAFFDNFMGVFHRLQLDLPAVGMHLQTIDACALEAFPTDKEVRDLE